MNTTSRIVSVTALALAWACGAASAATPGYHLIQRIPVGGAGGWDYLSVDAGARRLYVSHGSRVVVIDIDANKVVGEIADTPGVHGIALAPDLRRGFTTNGAENKAGIVDLTTLQTIGKVATGANPDGMLYDPGLREVYTFNGRGESATVIDARKGEVVATIKLGGKPEFAAGDDSAGRIFNNLENKSEVAVIDTATHQVVQRWPIAPGEEASGMAIDPQHHRLFIGCHNKRMVMMDSTNGRVVATVPIGSGVDANAFDAGTQLAFASCGDGTVTIAHEDAPDKLTVVQTLTTEPRARTMALDPQTHRIYLSTAKYEPAVGGETRRRPAMVPDSFAVLVYEPNTGVSSERN